MVIDEDDYDHVAHYGTPRHSGRYPWGSGDNDPSSSDHGTRNPDDPTGHSSSNPIPNNAHFLDYVENMKRQGVPEKDIAKGVGMTVAQLRAKKTIVKAEEKQAMITEAQRLKYDKGMSNVAGAKQMGIPESSFRALLEPSAMERATAYRNTADMLKAAVDQHKFVDVGTGVPNYLNISDEKLRASIAILEVDGYQVHPVNIRQVATGLDTKMKVLVPPGVSQKEAWENRFNIKQLDQVTSDGGVSYSGILPPLSIDPKRIAIRYGSEGGKQNDGVIYVREGVPDVALGGKRYAQVRVLVGGTHYMKGMAIYKEGLPDGVDLVFNTNKEKKASKLDALKKIEPDPDFPFGSVIKRQVKENEGTPHEKVTSAMNIVNEQGDWINWNRNISAQALSKQDPRIAKHQLDMTYDVRKTDYDSIMALTNPTVKKKLLETFADSTDAAAVHLKAAGFDRQNWHVILPIESIKPHQVYAPNYKEGETVALIRYPHGGTFEIPELTVNNRNREAKKAFGDHALDAIGIHHTVAEKLSGADFDGDTVLVIPNNDRKIKVSASLERLKGFDAKEKYKLPEGEKFKGNKQHLMGDVSNLITDMTLRGAPHSEIVRAVMHSMVVIDAEKHDLNHKQSAIDFGIKELKATYQGSAKAGASTLISRAKSEIRVPDQKLRLQGQGGPIDPVTGAKVWVPTGAKRTDKFGNKVDKTVKSKKLAETDDANTLLSGPFPAGNPQNKGTPMERLYADHSNKLKSLANEARLSWLKTPPLKQNASAKKAYATEVESLDAKLNRAQKRRPLERQAQIIANQAISAKRQANPNLDGDQLKKIKFQEQRQARARMGLTDTDIVIEDKEWDAIQAGAISNHKLEQILAKADMDRVRELATPKSQQVMTVSMKTRAHEMLAQGYPQVDVAGMLGVSVSTLNRSLIPSPDEEEED